MIRALYDLGLCARETGLPCLYRIFTYPRFDVSIRVFLLVKASLQSIQRGLRQSVVLARHADP
jgi:hypothetical protein